MKALLEDMKDYIEACEEEMDAEWGYSRELDELIAGGDMPQLYNTVLSELSKFK